MSLDIPDIVGLLRAKCAGGHTPELKHFVRHMEACKAAYTESR